MSAEQFLQWLLNQLCNGLQGADLPAVDTLEIDKATDALCMALEIARRDPTRLDEPQPTVGYTIGCADCTFESIRWTGIAFSRPGASILLQEHKAHAHHSHRTRRIG